MSSVLYTLGFPTLSKQSRDFIEHFRAKHDPQYSIVPAHFTVAFGCEDIPEDAYIEHVKSVTRSTASIQFHCRYAMLGTDYHTERGFIFLVPDEGNGAVSLLHDKLYTGTMAEKLDLSREFVPHITIGTVESQLMAKSLCDELNVEGISIAGEITALTVTALKDGKLVNLTEIALAGHH